MESISKDKLKSLILGNNEKEIIETIKRGFDPNYGSGWPIRLAARNGHYSLVKKLIEFGASPHLLSESGASTLQLAVYSGLHWDTDEWMFLLSCCDSSQLADAAAVAITFNNVAAFKKIMRTGRCNTNVPTSLTRKTVYELAKGYKLNHILDRINETEVPQIVVHPQVSQPTRSRDIQRSSHTSVNRNLSPSVARFFDLTARQPALTPPHSPISSVASLFSSQARP
ncbi:uncharacterized protein LOC121734176 [Aricia agestis]|uniref:uncharacterized protein LOC121734176 n=1 Tax=Aricia agestis TaxID=91739 RepID=UPI001C2024E9|nr:uncharacterized protein LOC121734176 [Aricia agestis]